MENRIAWIWIDSYYSHPSILMNSPYFLMWNYNFFPNVPNLFKIFSPSLPFHLLPPSSCTLFSLPYLPLGIFKEITFICHLLAPPLETQPSSFLYFTYVFSPSSWVTFFFFYRCNQNLFLLYICMHNENIFLLCIRI